MKKTILEVRDASRQRVAKKSAKVVAAGKAKPRRKAPPTTGPGSRQPVLLLTPLGDTNEHPLMHLIGNKLRKGDNKSDLARHLGVRPQSLYKWERACRADPHFPVPVFRARQFASYFRVKPAVFRPDFPWSAK